MAYYITKEEIRYLLQTAHNTGWSPLNVEFKDFDDMYKKTHYLFPIKILVKMTRSQYITIPVYRKLLNMMWGGDGEMYGLAITMMQQIIINGNNRDESLP